MAHKALYKKSLIFISKI